MFIHDSTLMCGKMMMLLTISNLAVILLVPTCFPSVWAISAHIEPLDPIVVAGSSITLSCILNDITHSSSDIVWFYKSPSQPIPSNDYQAVNESVSQLTLENVAFEESGTYLCALPRDENNIVQYEGTVVYAGLPASPAEGLHCYSDNILDYWCEWQRGSPSNLRTQYTFQYRQLFGNGEWHDCPDTLSKGLNTCYITRDHHRGYTQNMRVTSSNILGTAKVEINFNPDLETIPNPPSNVSIESRGPYSLEITWGMPTGWTSYFSMFLDYKLQFVSELQLDNWIEISSHEINGMRQNKHTYLLQNLVPYTRYHIRISCKSVGIMDDDHWTDWTEIQMGITQSAVPTATVTSINWREYRSHFQDPLYKRDVYLQWQKLHRHQQRGKSTGTLINVMLQLDDGQVNVYSETTTSNVIFVLGLEKYRDYHVQISACNVAGCGPNATVYLQDSTREPGAPKNVEVERKSSNSVTINWEMPGEPNGYILAYIVQWSSNNKDSEWFSAEVNTNETSYLIKGIDPETSYQYRVQTKNMLGYSGWTYAINLPFGEDFVGEPKMRSAQQILRHATQSLQEMMMLLRSTALLDGIDNKHLVV